MTKDEFKVWMDTAVNKNPTDPYNEWISINVNRILHEEPFDEEKSKSVPRYV